MDTTKLYTISQRHEFLDAPPEVSFTGAKGDGDAQRYEHFSRVRKRFEHPQRGKRVRGVVLPDTLPSNPSSPAMTPLCCTGDGQTAGTASKS